MASIPTQYCPDFLFSDELYNYAPTPLMTPGDYGGTSTLMHCEQTVPFSIAATNNNYTLQTECDVMPALLPERLDVCNSINHDIGWFPNFSSAFRTLPASTNWGVGEQRGTEFEEPALKVGRYSMEERREKILKYLKKRNQRNFNKTIKYACRKTLADKRVRVRGRFAKKNEPLRHQEDDRLEDPGSKIICDGNHLHHPENTGFLYCNPVQMEHEEEEDEWLREVMANLVYLPYVNNAN